MAETDRGGHVHSHVPERADRGTRRRLLIAFCIIAVIVVAQAVGSVITGSWIAPSSVESS